MAASPEQPKVCISDSSTSANNSPHGYDSDGYYEDGIREMNREEMNRYYQALKESEGFDVPSFPESYAIGRIEPIPDYLFSRELQECAQEAIKHYNYQTGTNFEVVKIVKANNQAARGLLYFITFEVKQIGTPPDFPTTTFQARVLAGIPNTIEVKLCRPKPSN